MRTLPAALLLSLVGLAAGKAPRYSQFVTTVKDERGVWWFERAGSRFLTMGVNHVNNGGQDDGVGNREAPACKNSTGNDLCGDSLSFCPSLGYAPYFNSTMAKFGGSGDAWAESALQRIKSWGLNTIGGWSATIAEEAAAKQGLVFAHLLDIGTTWLNHDGFDHDVFSQAFVDQCAAVVAKEVVPRRDNTALLGWQLDNEPNWDALGLGPYLQLGPQAPGTLAAIRMLQSEYGTVANLSAHWGVPVASWSGVPAASQSPHINREQFAADSSAFLQLASTRYFNVTTTMIREADPNHLILGVRNSGIPAPVLPGAAAFCDVIDKHSYTDDAPAQELEYLHNATGLPTYVSEFSFTAVDSNMPNTKGARSGHPYATQTERAEALARYTSELAPLPFNLGFHWWQWADEPSAGRYPEGEDSNYGLVTIADLTYSRVTAAMKSVTDDFEQRHGA